ncbi:MAG: hypothetical protein ACO1OB_06865, partial [Archangium sp.]
AKSSVAPALEPASPPTSSPSKPPVSITAAPAQKRQEREDRTVVMPANTTLPPSQGDDDVDFTSIVDNLGES